jgi:predicted phosphodiesterase
MHLGTPNKRKGVSFVFSFLSILIPRAKSFILAPHPFAPSPRSLELESTASNYESLEHVERVFCISDLHTDNAENMEFLEKKCLHNNNNDDDDGPRRNDLLVVAGDISHDMSTFQKTLRVLLELKCEILFVVGNHEAWLAPKSYKEHRNSLDKLALVESACRRMGVHTETTLIGAKSSHPLWVVPLQSWYDGSLAIEKLEKYCRDFAKWPWTDFLRCRWPEDRFPRIAKSDPNARIPLGLNEFFLQCNERTLEPVLKDAATSVLTVSHFLPNCQSLPDWKDLNSPVFLDDEWLDHGAAPTSAKFAKVAGSSSLDTQIRSLLNPSRQRLIHKFGHSHRPKDFVYDSVRYIHNPLGKPREREMRLISPNVDFQLVWDTRTGEVEGEEVVRYWEQYGGGADALKKRLVEHRKKRKKWARKQLSR